MFKRQARSLSAELSSPSVPGTMNTVSFFELIRTVLWDRASQHVPVQQETRPFCPEPSPWDAARFPASVLNVPHDEVQDFLATVIRRYLEDVKRYWPEALKYAVKHEALHPVSDALFGQYLGETSCCRLLHPGSLAHEHHRFQQIISSKKMVPGTSWYTLDLSAFDVMETLDGVHCPPTVTLLSQPPNSTSLCVEAILVAGVLYEPSGDDVWSLAKAYVLQGASNQLILGTHPQVHFPMDCVNALTRTILPKSHIVHRVLSPHFYMQLPLNYGVLYIDRSVAHNRQKEIYTPFPANRAQLFELMGQCFGGIPGRDAYPGYTFSLGVPKVFGVYGQFLTIYYDRILTFVRQVLASVTRRDDVVLHRWADAIASWLDGFPDARQIVEPDVLEHVVATIIFTVSVLHSADHASFSKIPLNHAPLRLRIAPPRLGEVFEFGAQRAVRRRDIFRQKMAHHMFFKPTVIRPLVETTYDLDTRAQQRAARAFRASLRQQEDIQSLGVTFASLSELACSIQF